MANPFNALVVQFTGSVDPANDALPFWQASTNEAFWLSRNTFLNLASQPVGTTDSQTLTNKSLTAPAISSPVLSGTVTGTYTFAGTPTFPSSVVTLTGTQLLTNKTFTAPVINGGSLNNAAVSVDSITGHTTANSGTVYGLSVTGGALGANTVPTSALVANAVTSAKLGLSAAFAGGVQTQTNTGSAGGTMWWLNLGGFKLLWATGAVQNVGAGGASITYNLPGGFFTSTQVAYPVMGVLGNTPNQSAYLTSITTTTATVSIWATSNGSTQSTSLLVIGT